MTLSNQPILSEDPLEERRHLLAERGGFESSHSLRVLRESGAPIKVAFNAVFDYGEEKWRMLRMAGYTLRELVDFMRNGYWLNPTKDEIGDPYFHLMSPWTRLFFYCGFDVSELKTVGFKGKISPEEESELKQKRARMTWRFP
jgi:hypothetical protein